MKTFLLIATAAVGISLSALPADAKDKYQRYFSQLSDAELASYSHLYERPARKLYRQVETHDTIRANAADPTHQYNLPDWARAALGSRGRR